MAGNCWGNCWYNPFPDPALPYTHPTSLCPLRSRPPQSCLHVPSSPFSFSTLFGLCVCVTGWLQECPTLCLRVFFGFFEMPAKHVRAKSVGTCRVMKSASSARLSPYLRGIVYGMRLAGATLDDIHKVVRKPDGSSISQQGICPKCVSVSVSVSVCAFASPERSILLKTKLNFPFFIL